MKRLIIFIFLIFVFGLTVSFAACGPSADGRSYTLCESIPGINPVQTDFASFFVQLYRLALVLGGTVIFIRVVYGGILYTWSGGVVNTKQKAITIFKGAAYGGALLMGSYLILYTINPALTTITVPDIQTYAPHTRIPTDNRRNNLDAERKLYIIRQNEDFVEATRDRIQNLEAAIESGRGGPGAQQKLDALYQNFADKEAEIVRLKQQR